MSTAREDLISEIARLATEASQKRQALLLSAPNKSQTRQRLTLLAGILAFLSGAIVSLTAAGLIANQMIAFSAAAAAFISAGCSLIFLLYFKDEDIHAIYKTAADYLRLRNEGYELIHSTPDDTDAMRQRLNLLQSEYIELELALAKFAPLNDEQNYPSLEPQASPEEADAGEARAFPSEVGTGSREGNATKQ